MNSKIEELVHKWATEENNEEYRIINSQINFLADHLYHDYEPVQASGKDFSIRLEDWVSNLDSNDERKTLFKILAHIFYFGQKEFNALYQVSYNEIISWWLIEEENISFDDPAMAKTKLRDAILKTWICPVTDSMDISSFYHINNIPGNNDFRPQWYHADKDWNTTSESYIQYLKNKGYKKLILMEDFVGSGSQIIKTIDHIMGLNIDIPILILPLIICPKGVENFNKLEKKYSNLSYRSVIELKNNSFLFDKKIRNEPEEYDSIRQLVEKVYPIVCGEKLVYNKKPYSPFGYKKTGGLIVMYTNTPDNTLPAIHHKSKTWNPIFERHSRN